MFKLFLILIWFIGASVSSAENDIMTMDSSADYSDDTKLKLLISRESEFLDVVKRTQNVFEKDEALAALGTIYMLKKDYDKAFFHLMKVGDSWLYDEKSKVISAANYNLGMIYLHGKGTVNKDYTKAFEKFTSSAWAGNIPAIQEIIIMCKEQEVKEELIHDFSKGSYSMYKMGKEHHYYDIASINLKYLTLCPSEKSYIQNELLRQKNLTVENCRFKGTSKAIEASNIDGVKIENNKVIE